MCFFSVLHVLASLHLFFHLPTLFSLPRVTSQLPACISALVIMEIICGSELCNPTRDISRRMKAAVSSRAGPCPRAPGACLRPPHQHAAQWKRADNTAGALTGFADFWRRVERWASGFCFHCGVFRTNVRSVRETCRK